MKIDPIESRPLYEIGTHFDNQEEKDNFRNWCVKNATLVHKCSDEYIFWIPVKQQTMEEVYDKDIPLEIKNEFIKVIEIIRKDEDDKGYLMVYII